MAKNTATIRGCWGHDTATYVVESPADTPYEDQIPDQLIRLGKFLRENPHLKLFALNVDYADIGELITYLSASIVDES